MNSDDVLKRLKESESAAALRSLGGQLYNDGISAPLAMVHAWVSGEELDSEKASTVALDLHEAAVGAMLRESETCPGAWRLRLMRIATQEVWSLRRRVLLQLEELLRSRAASSTPPPPGTVQTDGAPQRVSDAAYVLLRTLLAGGPESGPDGFAAAAFLTRSEAERDADIRRWSTSETCQLLHEET